MSSSHLFLGLSIALLVLYFELSSGFHSAAFTNHLSLGDVAILSASLHFIFCESCSSIESAAKAHTLQKKHVQGFRLDFCPDGSILCMVVCPDVLRKTSLCEPPTTTTTQTVPELNLPCVLVCGQLLGSAQQNMGKRHREPTHAKLNHCSKQQFQDLCLDRSAFLAFLAAPAAILVAVGCSKNVLRSRSDGQVRRETKRSRPPAKKERRTCACACRPL